MVEAKEKETTKVNKAKAQEAKAKTPKSQNVHKVEMSADAWAKWSVNTDLLSQYARVYSFNQRQGTAKTKTRGEVSGGGKKPWKQKGTGRARQGSNRAPHWVHGGISHGPKPKDWSLMMPSKMRKRALKSALALKAKNNQIRFIYEISEKLSKTNEFAKYVKGLGLFGKTLFISPANDNKLYRMAKNIKNVEVASAHNVNPYEILGSRNLVVLIDSKKVLEGRV